MTPIEAMNWNKSWAVAQEGPLTLLAKFAIANPQRTSSLLEVLSASGSRVSRGMNLLEDHDTIRGCDPFSRSLRGPRLLTCISPLYNFASSRHFRYCPSCLAVGYQSRLCQVDWLLCCPQHGDRLIDHCRHCGAMTIPYEVADDLRTALRCKVCRMPYAEGFEEAGCFGRWQAAKARAYESFADLLRRVDEWSLMWLSSPWRSRSSDPADRSLNFAVLLAPEGAGNFARFGDMGSVAAISFDAETDRNCTLDEVQGRWDLYLTFRNRLMAFIDGSLGAFSTSELLRTSLRSRGRSGDVVPEQGGDPRLLALGLFRRIFERDVDLLPLFERRITEPMLASLLWPDASVYVSRPDWCRILQFRWFAAYDFACSWAKRTANMDPSTSDWSDAVNGEWVSFAGPSLSGELGPHVIAFRRQGYQSRRYCLVRPLYDRTEDMFDARGDALLPGDDLDRPENKDVANGKRRRKVLRRAQKRQRLSEPLAGDEDVC